MADLFVCLTFDHDNTSSAISRNMLTPTAISRGDFGIAAAARILALLKAERIPATWFIPGHTIDSYPSCVEAVHAAGHEIGNHGWTHRIPSTLGAEGEDQSVPEFPATNALNPDVLAGQRQLQSVLALAIRELPERYQQVIREYYAHGKTMKEIGELMGVNESRVSQIHRAALDRMSQSLQAAGIHSSECVL